MFSVQIPESELTTVGTAGKMFALHLVNLLVWIVFALGIARYRCEKKCACQSKDTVKIHFGGYSELDSEWPEFKIAMRWR
jgi:hypothetical protein